MNKKITLSSVIISALVLSGCFAGMVLAQNNIRYPVAELGNCKDKAECKTYCDDQKNASACLDFAGNNNLMSKDEIKKAEVFTALTLNGPGGCGTKEACDSYCDDTSHINECVAFAEQNGLLSGPELEEAKKMQTALANGVTPPACNGKKECDVYCEDPAHMEECITFAIKAGFMRGQELENARKMLVAVKKGAKLPACKGKEECDAYCQQEAHFDECTDFAEAAGFMTADELEMARKTKGKGPGGCKGKVECDAFCNNPDNQEICFNFGKENGLIPAQDLQKMEEGKQRMKEALATAPAEVITCLQAAFGADKVEKIKNGTFMPPQNSANLMSACFDKMKNTQMPGGPGAGGNMTPGSGPGGCKSPEECKSYCESHTGECKNFSPANESGQPGNQMPQNNFTPGMANPGQAAFGPGGCKSPEECKAYCDAHTDECKNLPPGPGNNQPNGGMGMPGNSISGEPNAGQSMVGPGGCKSFEECTAYCQQNPQACQNFAPPNGQTQPAPNPKMPMNNQQPMTGGPGAGGNLVPGDFIPTIQPPPQPQPMMPGQQLNEIQPMPQNPPAGTGMTQPQAPPAPQLQQAPEPPTNPAPPPSGRLAPASIMASLISVFLDFFPR